MVWLHDNSNDEENENIYILYESGIWKITLCWETILIFIVDDVLLISFGQKKTNLDQDIKE